VPPDGANDSGNAANTRTPAAKRVEYWREARSCLQENVELWTELRQRGMLTGVPASLPEEVARKIARCDRELTKLTATSR